MSFDPFKHAWHLLFASFDNSEILRIISDNKTLSVGTIFFGLIAIVISGLGICGIVGTTFFIKCYLVSMVLLILVEVNVFENKAQKPNFYQFLKTETDMKLTWVHKHR